MTHYKTASKDIVPFGQKMAFGAGNLVNNLLPGALGIFMFFLVTAFGMDPFLAGLLGGLPRILDAITDPIMGYISDNTRSKYGRRRPYIFLGAILSGVLFAVLWQLDPEKTMMYNFWYFLIFSMIYIIGNTIFSAPLIGLGYEMTSDYAERTRLMGLSQTIGQLAWMIVPWFWIIIADPDIFETQVIGVQRLSIIVGAACMSLGILPAIFCKGLDSTKMEGLSPIKLKSLWRTIVDLVKSIGKMFKNMSFVRLCGATFLVFNGYQLVSSFSYFIIVYYMYDGVAAAAGIWPPLFSSVGALISAVIVIPIVTYLSNKYGKRKAFIIATALSIVGYALKWWGFSPGHPWMLFMPLPLMNFGIGGLFTLMMSMTADVCDLDELQNGMPRREGTFGAIYWWMVKLGMALAMVLGGLVLKLVGFDPTATSQTAETMHMLRIADIVIPVTTAALALWVMLGYKLSEGRMHEIKEELVARRGEL
ncbi:MAG: MFS transporter [Bacteroidales bacterium]|jgi:GPH family glycoside/pentoside/hexuronide:cation symporter|nr:MFS transporter [Bacteroidales bacterium]